MAAAYSLNLLHTGMQASDMLAKMHSQSQPLPKLTDLFSTGQLVRCTVTGLKQHSKAQTPASKSTKGSKKSVHLSLAVSKVNSGLSADNLQEGMALPACITSIEDHGYSLAFGVKGVTGFLPKKVHAKAYGSASVLKPGMLVESVVTSSGNKRLVKVTTDPDALSAAVLKDFEGLHIGTYPTCPSASKPVCVSNLFFICLLNSDSQGRFKQLCHSTSHDNHLAPLFTCHVKEQCLV